MAAVATRTHASVHAAYQAMKDRLGVSPAALREAQPHRAGDFLGPGPRTAADAAKVIDAMPAARKEVLPGLEVFYLDGNHLASTEHRLAELRVTREGPLPGQSLALLDAQRGLIVDLVPCEDGHAQERSLLPELLERIRAGIVIVADRNFCTSKFLFGLAARRGVLRDPAARLDADLETPRAAPPRRPDRHRDGLRAGDGVALRGRRPSSVRRITLCLDRPTESGDTEIHILTNLSPEQATALQVAQAYGTRWTVEGAFQTLTDVLRCEVETLGYPRAALFSFATAVLAYNTYAVVKASLACGARGRSDQGEAVGLPFDERRRGDVRRDGHRGPGRVLGVVPSHAGGSLREGDDEIGSSCEAHEISQEETRAEEAATEKEERASKSPYLDRPPTRETPEEKNLESGASIAAHL